VVGSSGGGAAPNGVSAQSSGHDLRVGSSCSGMGAPGAFFFQLHRVYLVGLAPYRPELNPQPSIKPSTQSDRHALEAFHPPPPADRANYGALDVLKAAALHVPAGPGQGAGGPAGAAHPHAKVTLGTTADKLADTGKVGHMVVKV
jgi:hypothetical protein